MESAGRPTERWMTLVPLSVFIFIVVVALGGPAQFVRTIGEWTNDIVALPTASSLAVSFTRPEAELLRPLPAGTLEVETVRPQKP